MRTAMRPVYALRMMQHCGPGMSFVLAVRLTARRKAQHRDNARAAERDRKLRLMTWG